MATQAASAATLEKQSVFSFGVITDVQYADIPDGFSFLGIPRYYRHSLEALGRAVRFWNEKGRLSFVIHLGDIVDGFCPKEDSYTAFSKVLNVFGLFNGGTIYHVLGNHCLYNLSRSTLTPMLGIPSSNGSAYYSFSPASGFQVVVIDGYDISVIGWPEGHPHRIEAIRILEEKNSNADRNSPEGLSGPDARFVMFNGGVGNEQLLWLDETLKEATACAKNVIICCHIPLHPDATLPSALLWNYSEVLDVIHKYECVKACLAGHTHARGYVLDSHGIHHCVLEAVLECSPGSDAFGCIDVYEDHLSLDGHGCMESLIMHF